MTHWRARRIAGLLALGLLSLAVGAAPLAADEPRTERAALPEDAAALGVGQGVALTEVVDTAGTHHALKHLAKQGAVVLAFTSPACPLSRKYAPVLARLAPLLKAQGTTLVLVDVMGSNTQEEFLDFARTHDIQAVCVHDAGREVAQLLGARTTTEVFLVDAQGVLRYRGAVDDQYGIGSARDQASAPWLLRAATQRAAGEPITTPATSAPGCALETAGATRRSTQHSWHGSISRLVQRHCMECHRAGGIAPFGLETYEEVVGAAGMLQWVVRERVMPPWFAAPAASGHATPWANDRSLPDADREALLEWLASDRPQGDPAQAPAPTLWPQTWSIGEPDLILELPREVEVKAEGRMPYVRLRVPTGLTEDRWVSAWEVLPTARDVVHHVLVFAEVPGREAEARAQERELDGFFAAFVPGNGAAIYGPGMAKRLPKGTTFHFQLHYTPNGTATRDRTRIALRFSTQPVKQEVRTTGIANVRLNIPAGAPDHVERAGLQVPVRADLLAFMPHLHVRGKSFRYDLITPDGERRTLLDVPRYDFNWQLAYRLKQPLRVQAGQRIEVTASWDNSVENPTNPDASKSVRWGLQSDDEMLIGYVEYVLPDFKPGEDPGQAGEGGGKRLLAMLLQRLDTDADGRVTREECPAAMRAAFDRLDTNSDGVIDETELAALGALLPK